MAVRQKRDQEEIEGVQRPAEKSGGHGVSDDRKTPVRAEADGLTRTKYTNRRAA